ncbi:MAG: guanylate kinase [Clostridiales Family XIII bacterium]|nr:guanylate kinase [Clostridiales Family XIII bacterium]
MKEGKLFVISGPSGAGKGTICKQILRETDASSSRAKLSISMTTRSPRPGEVDGVSYYFTDRAHFEAAIARDEFLEYADVYGNYYGTPRRYVSEMLANGEDVVLEIDVQGALQVKQRFAEAILIFILPPSLEVLQQRLVGRGTDAADVIAKRMDNALSEIKVIEQYDYYVINDNLEEATAKVNTIITAEHQKVDADVIKNYNI